MNLSVSKTIVWSLLSFIIGIAFSSFLFVPIFIYLPLIFLILIAWRLKSPVNFLNNKWLVLFILTAFIFGFVWHQQSFNKITKDHISFYQGEKITFQGKVIDYPEKENTKLKIILGEIKKERQSLKGKVLINTLPYSGYKYGDILELECNLTQPGEFQGFNYNVYLAKNNIYSVCYWPKIKLLQKGEQKNFLSLIFSLKDKIKGSIDSFFSEPQGSFLSAILLGIRNQLPDEVRFWFAQSGIAHILAVSGLHITILCQVLFFFFINVFLIPRPKAFYPTVLIIILFVLVAGAPASAVRAAIMGLGLVWTYNIGRPQASKRIILYTAVIMLLFNPQLLKADIGFQLSFLAILGINFLTPFFNKIFNKVPFKEYLAITLSAQIFTWPLVLYYFGNLSLISLLINIMVVPLMPLIMVLGFCFGIISLFSVFLARIILIPLWLLITLVILLVKAGSNIPWLSYLIVNFPLWMVIILYFLIFLWILKLSQCKNRKNEITNS